MVSQHGNFHIFRTQSYNTSSWNIYKKLMKDKFLNKLSKVPLENHFFNEAIEAQRTHIYEEIFGWIRYVAKIEFQMRGHPHIHEADWVPEGHDIYKIFQNNGDNIENIRGELDKLHKLYNRYITRMN